MVHSQLAHSVISTAVISTAVAVTHSELYGSLFAHHANELLIDR